MLSEKDVDFYQLKYSELSNRHGVFIIVFEKIFPNPLIFTDINGNARNPLRVFLIQVNLCLKLLFFHLIDCSLIYKFSTRKLQAQKILFT